MGGKDFRIQRYMGNAGSLSFSFHIIENSLIQALSVFPTPVTLLCLGNTQISMCFFPSSSFCSKNKEGWLVGYLPGVREKGHAWTLLDLYGHICTGLA